MAIQNDCIYSDPNIMGGTPVFKGTRLPIKNLREMGWSGTKNSALLKLMQEAEFTILLPSDRNIKYEQNLQQAEISVVVMVARTNRLDNLLPLIPKVKEALVNIKTEELIEVS